MKRIWIMLVVIAVVATFVSAFRISASATEGDDTCVPSDAWTEEVEHPAVTHEETVVVQEAVPEVWANFQPNNHKEPFVGPALWPSDPRGSWKIHNQIPGGHAGADGVYAKGNPAKGGNWFYRQNGVDEVTETVTVVDEEAYTEYVDHPAVECPVDPTDPPTTDEPTEEPTTEAPTEDPTDPPTSIPPPTDVPDETEQRCSENKCVRITRDPDGTVTDREVTVYPADRKDEGL